MSSRPRTRDGLGSAAQKPMTDPGYVTSLDEVFWGSVLLAGTMLVHGVGVIVTLRLVTVLRQHARAGAFLYGMGTLLTATLLLVLVHLAEVLVWAAFLSGRDAFSTGSTTFYYALMQYTTVGSDFKLPSNLRLLGGLIALSGILAVAWTTSTLFLVAQPFVQRYSGRWSERPNTE